MTDITNLPPATEIMPPAFLLRAINERLWCHAADTLRKDTSNECQYVNVAVHFSHLADVNRRPMIVGAWIFVLQRNEVGGFNRVTANVDKDTALELQNIDWNDDFLYNHALYTAALLHVRGRSVHREYTC